jgi:hypothetical protein
MDMLKTGSENLQKGLDEFLSTPSLPGIATKLVLFSPIHFATAHKHLNTLKLKCVQRTTRCLGTILNTCAPRFGIEPVIFMADISWCQMNTSIIFCALGVS